MTASRVGDVVAVEFPFTDMQGRKRRPGVVLAGDASELGPDDIIVRYRGEEIIGLTILHASRRSRVSGK